MFASETVLLLNWKEKEKSDHFKLNCPVVCHEYSDINYSEGTDLREEHS